MLRCHRLGKRQSQNCNSYSLAYCPWVEVQTSSDAVLVLQAVTLVLNDEKQIR